VNNRLQWAALLAVLSTACQDVAPPASIAAPALSTGRTPVYAAAPIRSTAPTGKGLDVADDTNPPARTRFRIDYHNGSVMVGASNVYFIWYGSWSASDQQIVTDFVSNVGLSPYWQITSRYPTPDGFAPNGILFFGGATTDSYSHGPTLSDPDVADIVRQTLVAGALPQDPAGIFVVLGSADITDTTGLDVSYCGLHNTTAYNGGALRYIYVGNPKRSPTRCAPQGVGPNGSLGADGTVTILSGELFNTITDPDFGGWYDKLGLEGADKCVWTFGTTYKASNGALANVHLGTRDFLVQQLWVPSKNSGACGIAG